MARSKSVSKDTGNYENHLKNLRTAKGWSQAELAGRVGLTRQAIYMIEANRYLPNATTALRIARTLGCAVEDLFSLEDELARVEAELVVGAATGGERMKLWTVGRKRWALPMTSMGEPAFGLASADALLPPQARTANARRRVELQTLHDPPLLESQIAVAGCDPALSVIADRLLREKDPLPLVVWSMGSTDALTRLAKGHVHLAGVHLRDKSGDFNVPFLQEHLRRRSLLVVTLAFWQMGLVVSRRNPKGIRAVSDLGRPDVRIVNRERGSGARQLLDRQLAAEGVPVRAVQGYRDDVRQHTTAARRVLEGVADAAVAPLAVARLFGLEFLPLEVERYDLVVPKELAEGHPGVRRFLDALSSRSLRHELDALGGYDTSHTGEVVQST